MKKIYSHLIASLLSLTFASPLLANTYHDYKGEGANTWWSPSRLYVGAYGGYGEVSGGYKDNGQVTLGRLSLGLHAYEYQWFTFGAELGVQSGNDMLLTESNSIYAATAFMPVQATLKPLIDFLFTAKAQLMPNQPLFGILKVGMAYRQLQLVDRTSARDDLLRVNGEVQAGLGYNITPHFMLTAFYQGIYAGGNAGVGIDADANVTIKRIPTQQAGFLGLEFSL